ncbi:MAG: hypothetical protein ABI679_12315 [Gemmatimonadota bacterium]
MIASLLLLDIPPGPDICHLLGFCSPSVPMSSGSNMLYLATALVLAGVALQRTGKRR